MLKIKDDVDLKELEKFGFKYVKNSNYPMLSSQKYYYDYVGTMAVYENTKVIIIKHTDNKTIDTLYDLIQERISRKGVEHENNKTRH